MSDSLVTATKNRAIHMSRALRLLAAALAASLLALVPALNVAAAPITYNGFTITDGQLGDWKFHNAKVYLTMLADTSTAQTQSNYAGSGVTVSINSVGRAFVTIVTPDHAERARFAPGQIFVAVDRGDDGAQPYTGGRGLGFGSVTATGFEPAYPLGIEDGTIDWGDTTNPSSPLPDLSLDLTQPTGFSGRAYICVGFPGSCSAPNALNTNKGPLTLGQPYAEICNSCDPLAGGLFYANYGHNLPPLPEHSRTSSRRLRYTGTLVSDVQVGSRFLPHAFVQISMDADPRTATAFSDGSGAGTMNRGRAFFKVSAGRVVIAGWFPPGSIYAFFDSVNGSVGFGSAAGRGYPLAITKNEDNSGLVEHSLMTAVQSFIKDPTTTGNYTAETATLLNWSGGTPGSGTASYSLQTPTVLSGGASSCSSYVVLTSVCSNLQPPTLKTTAGDFQLFEDYTDDPTGEGTTTYSINWGLFWVEPAPDEDEHDE
jgi:hypothetical protein